jgi:hypothetical protein
MVLPEPSARLGLLVRLVRSGQLVRSGLPGPRVLMVLPEPSARLGLLVRLVRSGQLVRSGAQGRPGVSGYQQVSASNNIIPGAFIQTSAVCPAGKVVLGGGYGLADPSLQLWSNGPFGNNAWSVRFRNNGTQTQHITITATCTTAD